MKSQVSSNERPRHIGFMLIPGFALTSFSLAIESLNVANEVYGSCFYEITICNANPEQTESSVVSSCKVSIKTDPILPDQKCDLMFICAYKGAAAYENQKLFQFLKNKQILGCKFASLTCGSFVLARARLMDGCSCTVHEDHMAIFEGMYPNTPVQENLFTVNRQILSCQGGASAFDMLMYIISKDHGWDFASEIATTFTHDRIRGKRDTQKANRYLKLRLKSNLLGSAIEIMESHIDEPYSIGQVAIKAGSTPRTISNVFKKHLKSSPSQYYLNLRLNRSMAMLKETHLQIGEIALATGFASQSYFTKRFREKFGQPPKIFRQV